MCENNVLLAAIVGNYHEQNLLVVNTVYAYPYHRGFACNKHQYNRNTLTLSAELLELLSVFAYTFYIFFRWHCNKSVLMCECLSVNPIDFLEDVGTN